MLFIADLSANVAYRGLKTADSPKLKCAVPSAVNDRR